MNIFQKLKYNKSLLRMFLIILVLLVIDLQAVQASESKIEKSQIQIFRKTIKCTNLVVINVFIEKWLSSSNRFQRCHFHCEAMTKV